MGNCRLMVWIRVAHFSMMRLLYEVKSFMVCMTMLFNVHDDPGEDKEVSSKNPAIVKRLTERIQTIRAEQVDVVGGGGHPDPTCPKYDAKMHNDPAVGAIWEPWCDHELELPIFTWE